MFSARSCWTLLYHLSVCAYFFIVYYICYICWSIIFFKIFRIFREGNRNCKLIIMKPSSLFLCIMSVNISFPYTKVMRRNLRIPLQCHIFGVFNTQNVSFKICGYIRYMSASGFIFIAVKFLQLLSSHGKRSRGFAWSPCCYFAVYKQIKLPYFNKRYILRCTSQNFRTLC